MLAGGAGRPPRVGGGGTLAKFFVGGGPLERFFGGGGPPEKFFGLGLSLFEADDVRLGGGGFEPAPTTVLFCDDVC